MELGKKYLELVNNAKRNIKEIMISDVMKLITNNEQLTLIDIREESEWNEKRIPGAIYIGKGILEREIETKIPDDNNKIILYCGGGYRSALSAENLQKMGYKNVFSMIGGISEWEENKMPIQNNKL
jgi:rhodanese-related sulfurtransferase